MAVALDSREASVKSSDLIITGSGHWQSLLIIGYYCEGSVQQKDQRSTHAQINSKKSKKKE